jgi:Fe-S-cluster-containing hydrogenase component 2
MTAMFIQVDITLEVAGDAEMAKKLAEVCPVNIFTQAADGSAALIEENLDECVLCDLCVQAAPPGGVRITKLYDGTVLER